MQMRKYGKLLLMYVILFSCGACSEIDKDVYSLEIPIEIRESSGRARQSEPVRLGVPFSRETLTDLSLLHLYDSNSNEVYCDYTVLARWGGSPEDQSKSIAVVLCDFFVTISGSQVQTWQLRIENKPPLSNPGVSVSVSADHYTVTTGKAISQVPRTSLQLLSAVTLADNTAMLNAPAALYIDGLPLTVEDVTSELVKSSGNRATVQLKGHVSGTMLDVRAVLSFFAGQSLVECDIRLENNDRAVLQGDGQPHCNDVCNGSGDASYQAPMSFDDFTFALPLGLAGSKSYATMGSSQILSGSFQSQVNIMQSSSGTDYWDLFKNDAAYSCRLQHGAISRSSQISVDGVTQSGPEQHPGWLVLSGEGKALFIQVEDFWQNFPKTLRYSTGNQAEIGLFPGEFSQNHVLRAGEYKTHRLYLAFDHSIAPDDYRGLSHPLTVRNLPDWYARSLFMGPIGPPFSGTLSVLEDYLSYFLDTSPYPAYEDVADNLFAALQQYDEYGYLDYGDLPTDLEVGMSPYNVKYDVTRGYVYQYLINGDPRWWSLARSGIKHFADIDIQHSSLRELNDPQRTWPLGGTYGHGYHDEDSRFNPHRNYMNPTHGYSFGTTGAFLYYLLKGDTLVLDSALEVTANYFWRLRHTEGQEPLTQCSECEGWAYWNHSRESADPLQAFLWAYKCTGEEQWLQIIRDGLTFQNTMEQNVSDPQFWSDRLNIQATNFRSIGEYLLYIREMGQSDQNGYAVMNRRADYLTSAEVFSYNGEFAELQYTYDGENLVMHDNWLLAVADGLALWALLTGSENFYQSYAHSLTYTGSVDPWYMGDSQHYHQSHVAVNAIGYANSVRYARWYFDNPATVPSVGKVAGSVLLLTISVILLFQRAASAARRRNDQ